MLHRTRMHWLCRPRQLCSNTPTDSLLSSHLPSLSLTDWLTFNSHTRINTQYTHTHTHKKKYERKQKGRRRDSDLLTEGRIEKIIIMRFRYCVTSPQLNYAMFNRYTSQFTSSNHYWYVGGGGRGEVWRHLNERLPVIYAVGSDADGLQTRKLILVGWEGVNNCWS